MDNNNIKYNKMKDGIYTSPANGGTAWFVMDGKILMAMMGQTYKTTRHFVFGEWKQDLHPEMIEVFNETYNKVKQW